MSPSPPPDAPGTSGSDRIQSPQELSLEEMRRNTQELAAVRGAIEKQTEAIKDQTKTLDEVFKSINFPRANTIPNQPPPQDPNKGPLRPADTAPSRTDVTWRTFKTRTPGGWIPVEESKELHDTLLAANGKSVVLQGFTYRLSGDANQYIQRFPVRRTQ